MILWAEAKAHLPMPKAFRQTWKKQDIWAKSWQSKNKNCPRRQGIEAVRKRVKLTVLEAGEPDKEKVFLWSPRLALRLVIRNIGCLT